jgi:hypothetical protein
MSPDASGKVFNDSAKSLVPSYESSVPAKPRPANESTTARTDDVVRVLFEIHRAHNGLPALRVVTCAPKVSLNGVLID